MEIGTSSHTTCKIRLEKGTLAQHLQNTTGEIGTTRTPLANTTGNKSLDCIRTNALCIDVLEFSKNVLKENGVVISKLFTGQDFIEIKLIF